MAFTIVRSEPGPAALGTAKPVNGSYYRVVVRARNTSSVPVTWLAGLQRLVFADGQKTRPVDRAPVLLNDMSLDLQSIEPGQSIERPVYFDVPPQSALWALEAHYDPYSTGVVLLLK